MSKYLGKKSLQAVSRVLEADTGWKKFQANLASNTTPLYARIGILEEEGSRIHAESGLRVVDLAARHEFGVETENLPKRSFIKSAADYFGFLTKSTFNKQLVEVIVGGGSRAAVLSLMGMKALDVMRARMRAGIEPELSPRRISEKIAKGRTKLTALFDTQELYRSLSMRVGIRPVDEGF